MMITIQPPSRPPDLLGADLGQAHLERILRCTEHKYEYCVVLCCVVLCCVVLCCAFIRNGVDARRNSGFANAVNGTIACTSITSNVQNALAHDTASARSSAALGIGELNTLVATS
jgi:hypothetical protein